MSKRKKRSYRGRRSKRRAGHRMVCGHNYMAVCACDGMVYGNPCEANAAGVDVSNTGGCKAPTGEFGCGPNFCPLTDYCSETTTTDPGLSFFNCDPLPAGCGATPTCACLASLPCTSSCMQTSDGGLHTQCMGI
jgi:hypothetical protein